MKSYNNICVYLHKFRIPINHFNFHQQVEYIMSSSIKLPAEEQGLLTGAGVSLKVDLASCLTSPPHVLITHQAQKTEVLEKLTEGSFVLTDSQDAMISLRDNGFVNIAAIDTLGMTLLRKVCYFSLSLLFYQPFLVHRKPANQ